ncbi:MAG: choice-of-anchor L domain-containing protein [Fimbriimonadaceae bacterium]|nr:choice-of-anchor L domain-containing protein [Chitinophagales bacterium]
MKKIFLVLILSSFVLFTKAQLTVWTEPNDTTFIYSLAGPGVTVSNLVRTCADTASGFYNSSAANVGIDSGIVLTSGSILNATGPNTSGSASAWNGYGGDADLDELIPGYYTYEACLIEFDMTVMADTVRINYVFGSEEYLEWVGSSFNDVFAFWVSGPGITDAVNIATVPGTDVPVAINNVNDYSYSDYYIHNGDGYEEPYYSDPFYIQYDGITVVMEGKIATISGETYHMKIAVADAGDGIYDTGVFLKTGSLGSLRMGTGYYGDGDAIGAGEKCSNGYIDFINYVPGAEDLVIDYHISGTAINGSDYELIGEQITIPAGMTNAILPIIPIEDAEDEGVETIILQLYNPQSGYIYNTLTFNLNDEAKADYTFSTTDATVSFASTEEDAVSWSWNFDDGSVSTEENPVHSYATGGTYNVCLTTTNANGCNANTCKQVSTTSGIGQLPTAFNNIEIYPNPATDHFVIELPAEIKDATATISNVVGEIISTISISDDETEINSNAFTKGMYYVTITSGDYSIVKTIQIQ